MKGSGTKDSLQDVLFPVALVGIVGKEGSGRRTSAQIIITNLKFVHMTCKDGLARLSGVPGCPLRIVISGGIQHDDSSVIVELGGKIIHIVGRGGASKDSHEAPIDWISKCPRELIVNNGSIQDLEREVLSIVGPYVERVDA